jgi:hypothetical protein
VLNPRERGESINLLSNVLNNRTAGILEEAARLLKTLNRTKKILKDGNMSSLLEKISAAIEGHRILEDDRRRSNKHMVNLGHDFCLAVSSAFNPTPYQKLLRISAYIQTRLKKV